jgi:two-component system, LytTR family, sensor kinase
MKITARNKYLLHVLLWLSYISINVTINKMQMLPGNFYFLDQTLKYIAPIAVFYVTAFFIFPRYPSSPVIIVAALLGTLMLEYIAHLLLYERLLPWLVNYPEQREIFTTHFFLSGFWWWLHYTLYGYAYWRYRKGIEAERQLRTTETARLQVEKEKVEIQYNYLRTQINPHFLFNTLNFLYGSTRNSSPAAAGAIIKLSNIMRYSLYDTTVNGLAQLATEWQQVNNYLDLHRLRSADTLPLIVEQQGPLTGINLPPHILITIIENAFKHGNITENEYPLHIRLFTDADKLEFTVTNLIRTNEEESEDPIGQKHIALRLAHQYGNKAIFEHSMEGNIYRVHLVLPVDAAKPLLETS